MKSFTRLIADDKGATAIEYAFLAMLIAIAAIGGMTALGGKIGTTFNNVASGMTVS